MINTVIVGKNFCGVYRFHWERKGGGGISQIFKSKPFIESFSPFYIVSGVLLQCCLHPSYGTALLVDEFFYAGSCLDRLFNFMPSSKQWQGAFHSDSSPILD